MTTTTKLSRQLQALLVGSLASCVFAAIAPDAARAQTVVVMVNGEPITDLDIESRIKLDFISTHKQPTRQEAIDELIDEKIKIKEAKKFGVDPSAADINEAYGQMAQRMRINSEQLSASLEKQGVRAETLKQKIKTDMVWGSLVRGRYKEKLQVGERDVAEAVKAEGGDDQQTSNAFEYSLRPVVLIVPKGSAPSATELRQKDAETLRARVETCDQASQYFKTMPNAAIRDTVLKTSAEIPAPLRKVLDETPVGHLTPPEVTKQGVEMVALCARKPTTLDTPKRKEMRDKMYAKKYEATSNTYLAEIRKAAMIEYRQAGAEDSNAEDGSGKKSKGKRN
jgi:peptidyl-prolyl cis-trans isomerase SurA